MLGNVPSLLLSSLRTLCPGDNFCNSLNEKLEKTERMMENHLWSLNVCAWSKLLKDKLFNLSHKPCSADFCFSKQWQHTLVLTFYKFGNPLTFDFFFLIDNTVMFKKILIINMSIGSKKTSKMTENWFSFKLY